MLRSTPVRAAGLLVAALLVHWSGAAHADEPPFTGPRSAPVDPYGGEADGIRSYYPPPPVAPPPRPYGAYPPPPAAPPLGAYLPGYRPPPFPPSLRDPYGSRFRPYQRFRSYAPTSCAGGRCPRPRALPKAERARYFSLAPRFAVLGVNQTIGGAHVWLLGGGGELRLRTRGRFGVELGADYVKGRFALNGPVERTSVPVELTALVYLFPNSDARHWSAYLLGGGGLVSTKMRLTDPSGAPVDQGFLEYEGHLGLGVELRFKWFAVRADGRVLHLWRDNGYAAGRYYDGVDGGPVPAQSWGLHATVAAGFWF